MPSDDFRNQRFKLIPRIVDGPWVVKASIPQKPALLGQKLTQRYFRGECYVETDVHVGSSIVANNVTGIGRSASTKICMDMGFVLEGRAEAELPEKVLKRKPTDQRAVAAAGAAAVVASAAVAAVAAVAVAAVWFIWRAAARWHACAE